MASPQLENGYTKIANELLEALCRLGLSGNEMRILLYIIRRTYGYNCKSAEISLSEISAAVGIRRVHIQRALKHLSIMNVIDIVVNGGIKPQTISIVKNYDEWKILHVDNCVNMLLPKMVTVTKNGNTTVTKNGNTTVTKNGNTLLPKMVTDTIKYNIKENDKERKKETDSDHVGEKNRVFINNVNYEELRKAYGKDIINEYLKRVDRWADKNEKNIGECTDMIRKWLEQDGVKKLDCDIEAYESIINQFLPL